MYYFTSHSFTVRMMVFTA